MEDKEPKEAKEAKETKEATDIRNKELKAWDNLNSRLDFHINQSCIEGINAGPASATKLRDAIREYKKRHSARFALEKKS